MLYKTQNLKRNNLIIIKKITNKKTYIIFHLGYNKCASPTLQDVVFPITMCYLGKGVNTSPEHEFAKKFEALAQCGPSIVGSIKQAKIWAKQVFNLKQKEFPDADRLIVSSEFFLFNNILKNRPIKLFFKNLTIIYRIIEK
jgi:hypothetical protein